MPDDVPFITAPAELEPEATAGGVPLAAPGAAPDDPSVAAGNPVRLSEFDALVSEITSDVKVPELRLKIDPRPGWVLALRVDVEEDDVDKFSKLADRKRRDGKKARPRVGLGQAETDVSEVRMAALLLAKYNTGLFRHGQPLVDEDSEPITLRSTELHALLEINPGDPYPSASAVRKLYGGLEGRIIAAGRALLADAGFLSEPEDADDDEAEPGPTTG